MLESQVTLPLRRLPLKVPDDIQYGDDIMPYTIDQLVDVEFLFED